MGQAFQGALALAQGIVSTVFESVVVLDIHLQVVTASASFYHQFNLTPEEAEGRFIGDLDRRFADDNRLRQLLEGLSSKSGYFFNYELEHHAREKSSEILQLNARLVPIPSSPMHMILLAVRNLTEETGIPLTLSQSEARLKEVERIASVGHWELDLITNKLYWSDEIYRIFNLRPQEFSATYEAFLDRVHPDDRDSVDEAYTDSLQNRTGYDIVHRLLLAEGVIKYVHEKCRSEYDDRGIPIRSLGTVQDITDQKMVEQELTRHRQHLEVLVADRTAELNRINNKMTAKIEELTKTKEQLESAKKEAEAGALAKSAFLANMSHEIRTPINAILGFSEILVDKIVDPDLREYVRSISISGKTLLQLIDDILDLSRIEAGKMPLDYQPVNLKELFSEVEQLFSLAIDKKGLDFEVEMDSILYQPVILDEVRFRQVILNLVGNAIKFTEKGYVRLTARGESIHKEPGEIDLIISVEDSGIGIAVDEQKQMFEAFSQQRRRSSGKLGGVGLGLPISKRLVELMNGEILLESRPEKGSAFTIRFPDITIGFSAALDEKAIPFNLDTIRFSRAGILIVDDVQVNLELLKAFLKAYAFDIKYAMNGIEAVEMARQFQPDLILMDMKMPDMDGYEATRILKKDMRTKKIPVIAITASAMVEDSDRVQRVGCDGYLKKPINKKALIMEMMRFLAYTINSTPAVLAEEDGGKKTPELSMSPEILRRLPELIRILNDDLLPQWSQIHRRIIISEMKAFSGRILQLGEAYSLSPLIDYGEDILRQVKRFDVEALSITMARFPELLAEINVLERQFTG